jgi:cell wall-associated NlpC family hydrolase
MVGAVVSLAVGGLGRDALRFAIGLVLALVIGIAFTIASVVVVIETILATPFGLPPLGAPVPGLPSTVEAKVVALAEAQIGTPYVWGGAAPGGFDCSGLVQWAYAQVGINLPRTAQAQYATAAPIDASQIQPGDLLFYAQTYPDPRSTITHVGIYIGNGQMINAPTDGDVVRVMPAFNGFWGAHFAGAGRFGG